MIHARVAAVKSTKNAAEDSNSQSVRFKSEHVQKIGPELRKLRESKEINKYREL